MNEEKVRKAFEVANELTQQTSSEYSAIVFARVFDAMLYEPQPLTTATAVQRRKASKQKAKR